MIFDFNRGLVLDIALLCLCLRLALAWVRLLLMVLREVVLMLLGVGCGLLLLLLLHVMGKLRPEVDHGGEGMSCRLLWVAEGIWLGHE